MKETLDSILAFLKTGIWFVPETGLSRPKAFLLKSSRSSCWRSAGSTGTSAR